MWRHEQGRPIADGHGGRQQFGRKPGFRPATLVVEGRVMAPQEYVRRIGQVTEELPAAEELLADRVRVTEKLSIKERAFKKLGKRADAVPVSSRACMP